MNTPPTRPDAPGELAAKIERLDKEATQGSWRFYAGSGSIWTEYESYADAGDQAAGVKTRVEDAVCVLSGPRHVAGKERKQANAALIVTLRNSVPAILTALRAAAAPAGVEGIEVTKILSILKIRADAGAIENNTGRGWEHRDQIKASDTFEAELADLITRLSQSLSHAERARAEAEEVLAKGLPFSHADRPENWRGLVEMMFATSQEANEFADAVMKARAALKPGQDVT